MSESAPKLIYIHYDNYSAKYIGKTGDGKQFFLTTPFVPSIGDGVGREFISLYLFDADGDLIEARIDDLGVRQEVDDDAARALIETRIAELNDISFGDIKVAPFALERFETQFGLIAIAPTEDDEEWSVVVEPGNYMAFHPPWDGNYDT